MQIDNDNPERRKVLSAVKTALDSTCQLYQWEDESTEQFVANGCAVLFSHGANYYCLSNAHVLADAQLGKTFFVLGNRFQMTVGGDMWFSVPYDSTARNNDFLDFAIVKLSHAVARHLLDDGRVFLRLNQFQTISSLGAGDILLLAGYPASKFEIDRQTNRIKFAPFMCRTIPYLSEVKIKEFNRGLHHIIQFPIASFRETTTRQRMRAPQPHGMSGSGLWLLEQSHPDENPIPILIGLLAEYHENQAVMISSKIDLFLDVIRQEFDQSLPNDGIRLDIEKLSPE